MERDDSRQCRSTRRRLGLRRPKRSDVPPETGAAFSNDVDLVVETSRVCVAVRRGEEECYHISCDTGLHDGGDASEVSIDRCNRERKRRLFRCPVHMESDTRAPGARAHTFEYIDVPARIRPSIHLTARFCQWDCSNSMEMSVL